MGILFGLLFTNPHLKDLGSKPRVTFAVPIQGAERPLLPFFPGTLVTVQCVLFSGGV